MNPLRRTLLAAPLAWGLSPHTLRAAPGPAQAAVAATTPLLQPRPLQFPRDHGAHPEVRTEWWYLTGHLAPEGEALGRPAPGAPAGPAPAPRAGAGGGPAPGTPSGPKAGPSASQGSGTGRLYGFQLTFFRSRVEGTQAMASRFAAKQLLLAHVAVTDLAGRHHWHAQRVARSGFDLAEARTDDTGVHLGDWALARTPAPAGAATGAVYEARGGGTDFALALRCTATQPLLLQGRQGWSRKGPEAAQASFYYSQPQLATEGTLVLQGRRLALRGTAWLDHEWSQALLHPEAVGWDWIGMNLFDGSALTAFRLRRADGSTLWSGGSFRASGGQTFVASPGEVAFQPGRHWTSPVSRARYPVEWLVRTPADFYSVHALLDAQEIDGRASTGGLYWEGLSELRDSNGHVVGRGYLEMTGYAQALRL